MARREIDVKVDNTALNDRVYNQIRYEMASGQFQPGEHLVIRRLAERYGTSATPVREAIQRLVAEGGLRMTRGRFVVVPQITWEDFVEIRRIRYALEGMASRLASPNLTEEDMSELEALIESMDSDLDQRNLGSYLVHNQQFHDKIYARANSPYLSMLIRWLWMQIGPFLNYLAEDEEFIARGNEGHRKILEAISRGSAEALAKAVTGDIDCAARSLERQHACSK